MTSLKRSTINEWYCLHYGKTNSHWVSMWAIVGWSMRFFWLLRHHMPTSPLISMKSSQWFSPAYLFLVWSLYCTRGSHMGLLLFPAPSVWIILPTDTCRHHLRANDSSPTPTLDVNSSAASWHPKLHFSQALQTQLLIATSLPLSSLRKWHCLPYKSSNNSPLLLPPHPPLSIHQLYFQDRSWIFLFPPLHVTTLDKPLLSHTLSYCSTGRSVYILHIVARMPFLKSKSQTNKTETNKTQR